MIRVLLFGLGPIGAAVARQLSARAGFRIVGAVDVDPAKAGRDVDEVVGLARRLKLKVSSDAVRALSQTKPDVAVLCTGSSLKAVFPQIEMVLSARVPIVSTTEELSFPVKRNAALARSIDTLAKRARVAVLGTGVNPGFVMDTLPLVLTGACERVDSIVVHRVQDAGQRRLPFQQKIGAGMTRPQFDHAMHTGRVRHVGLAESISMIADTLGWRLERITDVVAPKIAGERVASEFLTVERGCASGLVQDGVGYRGDKAVISLHMEAYIGAPDPYDSVLIEGVPRLAMTIKGGVHGDIATASIVVNCIPHVIAARPGLQTMRDLPVPAWYGGA